jgi:NitT/TauT family transport system permease protein
MLINQRILLVSPVRVILRLIELIPTEDFLASLLHSLLHITSGFLAALLAAGLLAALSARFRAASELLAPLMLAIRTIPVVSFIILALFFVSSKYLAILISFLMGLPIIYQNLLEGIRQLRESQESRQLMEMSRLFRLRPYRRMRYIILGQLMPYLRAACSSAIGLCWKAGTAAEVIGMPHKSIGEKLQQAKIYLNTPDLLAWTLVLVLVSLSFEKIFLKLLSTAEKKTRVIPGKITDKNSKDRSEGRPVGIRIRNLSKSFGGKSVLENFSADLPAGSISALMAPSGSGKTTLLNLIAGLMPADDGSIVFDTEESGNAHPVSFSAGKNDDCRTVSFSAVFQEDRLLNEMTAESNVRLVNPSLSLSDTIHAMADLGLRESAQQSVRELSGGMKRRVAILRAVLHDSDVLLLDEPFQGLDEETRKTVISFLRKKAENRTVLLITHNKEDAEDCGAEQILHLSLGPTS